MKLTRVKLLEDCLGYKAGSIVHVPPKILDSLLAGGVAELAPQTKEEPQQKPETAARQKRKIGRPAGTDGYKPEFCKLVKPLAQFGGTNEQFGFLFKVSAATIVKWRGIYPEFNAAITDAKNDADRMVVNAMFQRACGYSHPDFEVRVVGGKIVKIPLVKHYPPDATSCIFWLKNRQSTEWKDRVEQVVQDTNGNVLAPITVRLVGGGTLPQPKLPITDAAKAAN